MDRLDDLGVVDAMEIDGRDAEVAVAELALDDDERHAFARHLDGVRVAELVRREPPPDTSLTANSDAVVGRSVMLAVATTRPRSIARHERVCCAPLADDEQRREDERARDQPDDLRLGAEGVGDRSQTLGLTVSPPYESLAMPGRAA
jgi:hypothetical protein